MMKRSKASKYLKTETYPIQIDRDRSVAGLLAKMEGTSFQGRNLAAEPCEGFEEVRLVGPSPLALDMQGFRTDFGDVLHVSLGDVDPMPGGLSTAQRYAWEGVVEYVVEDPDAAHQA